MGRVNTARPHPSVPCFALLIGGRREAVAECGGHGVSERTEWGTMTPPFRDPSLPSKPKEIPIGMNWQCRCGRNVLRHHEYCAACGSARPMAKENQA